MPPFGRDYNYELADRNSNSRKCGSLFGDADTTYRRNSDGSPRPHDGIDLKAVLGTPLYAALDGVITISRWRGEFTGYGVRLKVENEFGTIQFDYFHLDELAFGLNPGETIEVKAGDQIGTAGFTGFDPAEINVHVHFQMKMGDTLVDPMAYSAYLWKFHKCKCAQ